MRPFIRSRFGRQSISSVLLVGCLTLTPLSGASGGDGVPRSVSKAPATHQQLKVVRVASSSEGQKLEDFCVDEQGRILVLLGPLDPNEPGTSVDGDENNSTLGAIARLLSGKKKRVPHFDSAVHVYDGDGNLAEKWPVGFSGQAINIGPDGTILVGGNGRVASFDTKGTKLLEAESPQMTYINNNPDEMRERAKEQLESDRAMYAESLKEFESQLEQLQKSKEKETEKKQAETKDGDESNPSPKDDEGGVVDLAGGLNEQNLKLFVDAYKRQLAALEKKTVEESLQEVTARARRIHAIAGSQDDIFITCPAMAGYGYGVWRTDRQFAQAKEIVKSLSGCCGQMDVQCQNGELYVCENSRHRVIRFDREGKEIAHFGKRDREGEGENFGGCCNPMNLCFNKHGDLYVSESNGVVKHFTPDGSYVGIVGVAKVNPGCKNSCVGVTADDNRLFYIDIDNSKIIILARSETVAAGNDQN